MTADWREKLREAKEKLLRPEVAGNQAASPDPQSAVKPFAGQAAQIGTPQQPHSPERKELPDSAKSLQESPLAATSSDRSNAEHSDHGLEDDPITLKQRLFNEKWLREKAEDNSKNLAISNRELNEQLQTSKEEIARLIAKDQEVTARESAVAKVESANREEADHLATLADTLNPRDELDKDNRSLRSQNTRLTNENAALIGTFEARLAKIERLNADKKKLRDQLRTMTDTLNRVESENRGLRSKFTRAQRELELASQSANAELNIRSFETVRWLVESGMENHSQLFDQRICSTGSGPWAESELRKLLRDVGFKTYQCGSTRTTRDIEIVVVGREDWDADAIEAQIINRDGSSVKVFPQELFVAALACGSDPFDLIADEDDPDIPEFLEAFGRDHPAIEHLRSLEFPWPDYKPGGGEIVGIEAVEKTPLVELGYHVGKIANLDDSTRRGHLKEAFFHEKLPRVESDEYMQGWGRPGSRKRLRRMAWHLAWLIRKNRSRPSWTVAIKHWITDLAWLEEQFYKPLMRFQWPIIRSQ